MDSTFIHQKANELVLRAGSRDLRTIAKTVGMAPLQRLWEWM